jgi:hypothetical protein
VLEDTRLLCGSDELCHSDPTAATAIKIPPTASEWKRRAAVATRRVCFYSQEANLATDRAWALHQCASRDDASSAEDLIQTFLAFMLAASIDAATVFRLQERD